MMNLNVSHLPLNLHFGLCLPKECSQDNIDLLNRGVTNFLNNGWKTLQNFTNVETDLTKNWTTFQVQILKVDAKLIDQRESTAVGFVIVLALTCTMTFLFCLVPTVLHSTDKVIESVKSVEFKGDSGSVQIAPENFDINRPFSMATNPNVENNRFVSTVVSNLR